MLTSDATAHRNWADETVVTRAEVTGGLRAAHEGLSRDGRACDPLRETPAVKAGKQPPECPHGTWTFADSNAKRGASKWRCPTGECAPKSVWIKASRLHTLIR